MLLQYGFSSLICLFAVGEDEYNSENSDRVIISSHIVSLTVVFVVAMVTQPAIQGV